MSSPGAVPILSSSPRPAPPTPQEIQRKLGSPTAVPPPPLSVSTSELDAPRRLSVSRRAPVLAASPSLSSSTDDDEPPSSPNRGPSSSIPLSAISEASDNGSGTDSDTSSVAADRPVASVGRTLDRLRLSRENTRMSDNVAVKSGYLMKKGERRKAWKKRWFVLRGGQVAMYKNDKEYQLLRLIPLTEIHSCAPIELKKHSFTFGIVTPKRTYYVKADNALEVQDWCSTVERAKEELKAAATISSLDTPSSNPSLGEITPQGPQTPTAAIPIPSSAAPKTTGFDVGGSYNTTATSPSPPTFTPTSNSHLSSSFTSTSTSAALPGPRVPPNSFAVGGAGALGLQNSDGHALELAGVDAELGRLAGRRGGSFSTQGSLSVPAGGYFASRAGGGPPLSPGGAVSSSEDEDGFEANEGWGPKEGGGGLKFAEPAEIERRGSSTSQSGPGEGGFGDPNKVIVSGYLMKQGGKRRNWRKRWFVLMSGSLMYSRSHMDTKIHRQIPLARILDAIEYSPSSPLPSARRPSSTAGPLSPSTPSAPPLSDDGKKNYEHCFKIITPKRTYLVCAPTEEDEIRWLAALQCLVARRLSTTTTTTLLPPPTRKSVSSGSDEPRGLVSSPPVVGVEERLGGHGRQRSVTDAARLAVRNVERRFEKGGEEVVKAA